MAEKQGVADLLDLIKNYARQETTEPLKGAGRWIGFGLLGSVLLMLGARSDLACFASSGRGCRG